MNKISDDKNLEIIRHSMSHIMAAAVQELWPDVKLAIGPAIETGFYYDFDFGSSSISDSELLKIEERMREIIKKGLIFEKMILSIEEAIKREEGLGQIYKKELLEDLRKNGEKEVSYFRVGNFVDLCRGPHIKSTLEISLNSFKLIKLAGAYWRGDEKNKMLTRIYGVGFATSQDLEEYLKVLAETEQRDHRRLGRDLEFFMISEDVGKGLPLWLPNGAFIRRKLEDYIYEKEFKAGYKYIYTPILTHKKLYEISGHLAHYREDMYSPIDIEGEEYYLKPMNCPHHHQIYSNKLLSYKDLPLRLAEFGICHRFERSGVLSGLIRARCFTQNDAHIYCRRDQLKGELLKTLQLFQEVYNDFDIHNYWFRLSLPDFNNKEKYGDISNIEMWETAAQEAKNVLEEFKVHYEEAVGEASFYGPKIDVQIKNVLGKEDTIATMQLDFYSAGKFNLFFINNQGEKEQPVIIHRAIMGSFDRFFAFLVEKYSGSFPLWLSPIQVKLISVGEKYINYCYQLSQDFFSHNIRVAVDDSNETVSNKIRKAVIEKIPYVVVIGDREISSSLLTVRDRGSCESRIIKKDNFIQEIKEKVENKF